MFSKLFARITESSLMEEDIMVRYTFIMMLAIADAKGLVIGTDIAISRRLNMPLAEFRKSAEVLMAPDPDSNSPTRDGRRIIPSEGERGYELVNYLTYRQMKNAENKKEYMREYMRAKRRSCKQKANTANNVTLDVTDVTQAEEEADTEAKAPTQAPSGEFDLFETEVSKPQKPNKARGTIDELRAFAVELGLPPSDGDSMFLGLEASGWRIKSGPLKCWRSHMRKYKQNGWHPSQDKKQSYGTKRHPKHFTHSPANAGTCNAGHEFEY